MEFVGNDAGVRSRPGHRSSRPPFGRIRIRPHDVTNLASKSGSLDSLKTSTRPASLEVLHLPDPRDHVLAYTVPVAISRLVLCAWTRRRGARVCFDDLVGHRRLVATLRRDHPPGSSTSKPFNIYASIV